MLIFQRERTPTGLIMYALYLYFLGLSFRNTAKALDPFVEKKEKSCRCMELGTAI